MNNYLIQMRRYDTSSPWGFRLNGGADLGIPLHVQKVVPKSLAQKAGLQIGDGVIQIGPIPSYGMSHNNAKMEIIRQGNELDFVIQRNTVHVVPPQSPNVVDEVDNNNSSITIQYEKSPHAQNPAVQSRSFKMLQQQLQH